MDVDVKVSHSPEDGVITDLEDKSIKDLEPDTLYMDAEGDIALRLIYSTSQGREYLLIFYKGNDSFRIFGVDVDLEAHLCAPLTRLSPNTSLTVTLANVE